MKIQHLPDAAVPEALTDPLAGRKMAGNPTYDPVLKIQAETTLQAGRTNYYLVWVEHPQREDQAPYRAECEDLIEALGLTFDEGNIFKEIWRTANARKGNGKPGQDDLRAGQKIVHYAKRILRKVELAMNPAKTMAERHPL